MILDEIIFNKRQEVTSLKVKLSLSDFKKQLAKLPATRDFFSALSEEKLSLIAEIKKASPSVGIIVKDFNPADTAKIYQEAGASAISVLTDEKFFQGGLPALKEVRKATSLPLLRKDFIIDESQIYESRLAGADAVLLITRILNDAQLKEYLNLCHKLDMEALLEVHTEEELKRALKTEARIIGINNRDLDTFKVNLETTLELIDLIPKNRLKKLVLVSESGIESREDVQKLKDKGADAVLIGEALLRSKNIAEKIKELMA